MHRVLTWFTERQGSWLGLLAWLVCLAAAFPLSAALEERLRDDPTSYLARGSDSLRAIEAQAAFPGGARSSGVIIAERLGGGLTTGDRDRLESLATDLSREPALRVEPLQISQNGRSAAIVLSLPDAQDTPALVERVTRIRERMAQATVIASAVTTMAALATLLLSHLAGTVGLAAVGVIGIAVVMLAMTTLLPALLGLTGRWVFWPATPRFRRIAPDDAGAGLWAAAGRVVARTPVRTWAIGLIGLGIGALGLLGLDTDLHRANGFITANQTTEGYAAVARAFPAGLGTPAIVVVQGAGEVAQAVQARLAAQPDLAIGPLETAGALTRFGVTFPEPPFGDAGFARLQRLRAEAGAAGPVLIGGSTAEEVDVRTAARRDEMRILPLVLVVVGAVLVLLLRAVVVPLLLLSTVALSFAAALGISDFLFATLFGFAGTEPTVPLFAFVFLIALGIDYNIFLIARIREEAQSHDPHEAIGRGLARTGGVITAAGLVLAATFAVLAALATAILIQTGFTVALGLLLDTFLVRIFVVPALLHSLAGTRAMRLSA